MREKGIVVAIDGPSGAGKSTVGRALARELGYSYLDTGAMYRAVALRASETNTDAGDEQALASLASSLDISLEDAGRRVMISGVDVSEKIRTREIAKLASKIAKIGAVRRELVRRQQDLGRLGGAVLDGRDIGTVVFPSAEAKFYLDAAPEKRARRRADELAAKGQPADFEAILEETRQRDRQDMLREDSPLERAADARYVDTTDMSAPEVLEALLSHVRGTIAAR